ncbi:MAG: Fic family protein [Cyanobacteria bacterium J06631_9]
MQIGRFDGQANQLSPQLRKQNRIQTIQSTLAIEGNTLTIEQVTAILEGKRVLGQPREIQEVKGTIQAYESLPSLDQASSADFLTAHGQLMGGVFAEAGRFRKSGVGIQKNGQIVHMAPPAKRVPKLMADLFEWTKASESHALVKSCVFHYELEFIHPFMDGNGRMGRLWQTLILGQWNDFFFSLPIESVIKNKQMRYYQALEAADKAADSTIFIEFMLEVISDALYQGQQTFAQPQNESGDQVSDQVDQVGDQVKALLKVMDDGQYWSTQALMQALNLYRKPTFRKHYLNPALQAGLIVRQYPDSPRSPRQKYKKI